MADYNKIGHIEIPFIEYVHHESQLAFSFPKYEQKENNYINNIEVNDAEIIQSKNPSQLEFKLKE